MNDICSAALAGGVSKWTGCKYQPDVYLLQVAERLLGIASGALQRPCARARHILRSACCLVRCALGLLHQAIGSV